MQKLDGETKAQMNGPLDALAELVVTLNVAYEDEVLALKKTGEIEAAASIVARCYVNSTSTIDLAEIIAEQYKLAATPSRHVCVTRLAIVESRNEKAVDVAFRCTRPAMLPHHCHIAKCQNSARNEPPCLLVASSNTHTVHSPPQHIFSAQQNDSSFYAKYSKAVNVNLECMVTPTRGGSAMEYLSHELVIVEKDDGSTEILRGDWLLRIVAANKHAFSQPVTCHRLPARAEDVKCFEEVVGTKQNCSFVFDVEDWRNLYEAVNDSVMRQLQDRVVFLDDDKGLSQTVGFTLEGVGEVPRVPNALGVTTSPEKPGNVYTVFEIEMKFV